MAARGRSEDTAALEPREADERYDRFGNVVKQLPRTTLIQLPATARRGPINGCLLLRHVAEIVYRHGASCNVGYAAGRRASCALMHSDFTVRNR